MYSLGDVPIRWSSDSWTLKERQSRSWFPDCVLPKQLRHRNTSHDLLQQHKIKSFNLIETPNGKRQLKVFFTNGPRASAAVRNQRRLVRNTVQSSRVSQKAGDEPPQRLGTNKQESKVPPKSGQADASRAKKNKKKNKNEPSGSTTKKKSRSSKHKKSSLSCGASNDNRLAELLLRVYLV
ncbi:hypothetical protein RclHR1_07360001 [Rhizophagus clarus]|uniref:Uncharacterized protein n=1 Tax=Rhizophagus clarus TaxID=94130 RepID=A0A2Z6RVZ1_9GLOM|nr:hypothetical protein RclHR1_07360001 [Rhizophagus clarus]